MNHSTQTAPINNHYKVAGPDIVHEDFAGDLVILNLASGQYFGLNAAGAILWKAIVSDHNTSDLSKDEETLTAIKKFAAQLQELGLIAVNEAPVPDVAFSPIVLTETPMIEVYDDLADLIVADPIHDVDAEKGWPKAPAVEA